MLWGEAAHVSETLTSWQRGWEHFSSGTSAKAEAGFTPLLPPVGPCGSSLDAESSSEGTGS